MRSGNKSYNRHQILILLYPSSNLLPTLKQYFSVPSKFIYHSAFFTTPSAVLIQATTIIAEWPLCPSPPPGPPFLAPCYLTIQLYPHCLLWYSQDTSGMLLPDCICLFCFLWFAWVFLQIFAWPITLFLQKIFNQITISQKSNLWPLFKTEGPFILYFPPYHLLLSNLLYT